MSYNRTDEAARGAVLALKATTNWSATEISAVLGQSVRQINRIYSRAVANGFDPTARPLQITNAVVSDRPKTGRPKKRTNEAAELVAAVKLDCHGRERTCSDIAVEMRKQGIDVSAMTVWRILRDAGRPNQGPSRD
ncbi:hypothetical protein ACQKWADRAFT_66878 [Trichoderma austrokoningii]